MQITKENLTIIMVTIKSQNIIDDCLNQLIPISKKLLLKILLTKNLWTLPKNIKILNAI